MGKKDNNHPGRDRPRRRGPLMQRAVQDVQIMQRPALNAINREQAMAQEDYLQGLQAANSAYGGFQNALQTLPALPTEDIAGKLQTQLSGLSNLINPQGMPPEETLAAQNLQANLGAGAMNDIYSQAMRYGGYQQSAGREGALAQRYAGENLAQSMEDALRELRSRRLDVTDQTYLLEKQRLEELRQQALENKLVHNQLSNDEAFANWLMGDLQQAATKPPRRNKPKPNDHTKPDTHNQNRPVNYERHK